MHYLSFQFVSSLICLAPWDVLSAPTYQYHREPQANEAFASRDYFYVGGEYVTTSTNTTIFVNQMYVERLVPSRIEQPYPVVFIHGQSMTGTNWLNKPDGAPGWATYFLSHGYEIYIVDQPARGRSAWNPNGNTTLVTYTAERTMQRFTATERYNLWPQAALHTQWPGNGSIGDPIFDAFYTSTVQFQSDTVVQEINTQKAGAALLNRIGPAVLLSHSQGGLMPWVIADKVPELVKAIVAIEPTGPPFQDVLFPPTTPEGFTRNYGITDIPLQYEPEFQIGEVLEKILVTNQKAGDNELKECWLQREPARQLKNLKGIKVLVESAEASFHRVYDGCTVEYLKQAGVEVQWMKLGDEKDPQVAEIHGNGHMQFMEKNSDIIAGVLDEWIREAVGEN
ncbi:uncharacterized protein EAE98_009729 [Botrytis deweyae]|uniref:AB hydrolase-1 domain-containing protein n=1 Tax=Botrytis deweyae TaxID=2478750 RepID=A0ABQ7IB19_9HELO|nr:uncharacterized protein EAE98_009729 [Botrytis deweyae]KAF7918486.1 hypothetical protein EAE98_009729 [Botrytis deweyae]